MPKPWPTAGGGALEHGCEDAAVTAFEVRRARPEDARGWRRCSRLSQRSVATEPPVDVDARTKQFAASIDGTILAVAAGDLVGSLHVDANRFGVGELGMAVARPWRGRGVGTALLTAAIEKAQDEGLHKLSLEVFPHNEATDVHVTVPTASPAELIVTWIAGLLRRRSLGNRFVVVPTAACFDRAESPEPTPTRDRVDVDDHVLGRGPLLHVPEGNGLDPEPPSSRGDHFLDPLAVLVEFSYESPAISLALVSASRRGSSWETEIISPIVGRRFGRFPEACPAKGCR